MLPILDYVSAISNFIPLITGLILFRFLDRPLKLLLLLIGVNILTDATSYVFALHRLNNMPLFHLYTLIEYIFVTFIFSYWQKSEIYKMILRASIFIFTFFWCISKFTIEHFSQFDQYTASLSSTMLTFFALLTLITIIKENLYSIFSDHRFWVAISILLYSAGNFFFFALGVTFIWNFHNLLSIICNLGFTGGFLSKHR